MRYPASSRSNRLKVFLRQHAKSFRSLVRDFVFGTYDPDQVDAVLIEPRILYSATPLPIDIDGHLQPLQDLPADQITAIEEMVSSIVFNSSSNDLVISDNDALAVDIENRHEAIFIDAALDDIETLLASIESSSEYSNYEIFLIDHDSDGLSFVVDVLAQSNAKFDAIHFVTHGSAGAIQLGNEVLSLDSFDRQAALLKQLGIYLTDEADLLIYGCNVASSLDGQLLLSQLANVTGADIGASDDLTGATELNGDWDLEFQYGQMESSQLARIANINDWQNVLATINVTTTVDENNGSTSSITALQTTPGGTGISLREAIIAANNTAGSDTIVLGSGTYTLSIVGDAEGSAAQGDLDINSTIIIVGNGPGLTIINATSMSDRVFEVSSGASLTLSNLQVTGGIGGTYSGGAVFNNGGTLIATDVVFANNSVSNSDGGAIHTSGTTTLTRVSLINNSAINGGAINVTAGTTTLTNVTISGNTADYDGGGIRANGGTTNISFTSIGDNTATGGNGGGIQRSSGTVTLSSSAIGDNTSQYGGRDINGAVTSSGYNIIENHSGFTQAGTDWSGTLNMPAVSLDATSGQYFYTISAGGLAQNGGNPTGAPTTDIHGRARDSSPDIGSYELNNTPVDLYVVPNVTSANITGYFSFTSTGNLGRDDSGDTAPMTLVNSPTQTTRLSSNALDLAGGATNQHGVISNLTTGGAMTIASWVRFDTTGAWQRVFDFGQANSAGVGNIYVGREGTTNNLTFTIEINGSFTYRATATNAITNGTWMHFVATVNSSGNMVLYVNGVQAATQSGVALSVANRTNNYIGRSNWAGDSYFDGAIDDFLIANGAMSAADALALYQQTTGFTIAENSSNGSFIGTLLATDPDSAGTYTYSLVNDAGGRFAIDASSGQITVSNGSLLNFESATSHTITARVTDQSGLSYDEVISISLTNTNDAPVMNAYAPAYNTAENAASFSASVTSLLGSSVTDEDSGSVRGIALHSLSGSGGTLEYSINGGTTWLSVGSPSTTSAILLRATDLIRFTPSSTNGGTMQLSYYAWDQTSGTAGSTANVTTRGGTTAFSTAGDVVTINTSSVNDAPNITNGHVYSFTSTNEDTVSTDVFTGTILLAASWNDVDTGAIGGMAITGTSGNGTWQYSTDGGGTWTNFGSVSSTNALLLTSTTRVRYLPSNNGETATFTYKAWDQTSGTASTTSSQSYASTASSGGTTAFSTNNATAQIVVTSVNDAPVLDNTGNMTLTSVNEDQTTNAGNSIASIISSAGGDRITDADTGAVEGIAITSTTNGNGWWEYSTNGGSSWTAVGSVSNSSALLLRSTDFIRFIPNNQNATTGDITFRAWDQTSGSFGTKVDTSVNGGTTAFSLATEVASITVTAVNDNPTAASDTATAVEAGGTNNGTAGTNPTGNVLTNDSDVDSGDTRSVTGVAAGAQVSAAGSVNIGVNGSFGSINIAANGSYTYTVDNNNASVQALRTSSNTLQDVFTYTITDAGGLTSSTQITITIQGANDAPNEIALVNNSGTNLVNNGSFETNNGTSGGASTGGGITVSGWTAIGGEGFEVWKNFTSNGPATASDGTTMLELDVGAAVNGIAQDISTSVGQLYVLSFDFSGRAGAPDSSVEVYWRNVLIGTISQAAIGWNTYSFVVTGSGGSDSLRFMEVATESDSFGSLLDNVRLIADQSSSISIAENSANGTFVARAGSRDLDTVSADTFNYSLVNDAGGRFAINATTGVITVANGTLLNFEAATAHQITIRVTDASVATYDEIFTINVSNVNEAVTAMSDSATAVEAGGTNNGTAGTNPTGNVLTNDSDIDVGDTKTVTGVSAGVQPLGTTPASTPVAGTYGSITIAADGSYIYTVDNYNASVQALRISTNTLQDVFTYTMRDAAGLTSTTQITVTIQGANDTPYDITGTLTVAENSANTTLAGTVAAFDRDSSANGETASYSLVDDAGGRFAINTSTGQVTVANGSLLNFEASASHNITVRVTDASGATFDKVIAVTLTNTNDAPVLDSTGTMTLNTIDENQTANSGQTVASIIASAGGDRITDQDSGALEGIAITATTNGNGWWEYSTDGGSSWTSIGTVTNSSALLLRETDRIRFVPNSISATTGNITFRAWDQTSGSFGTKVDTSVNGGTTAFSSSTETASITVTEVNDEQVLATNTGTTVAENSIGNVITSAMLATTDIDHAASQLTYTVITASSNGTLRRNGVALTVNSTFTQADINAGLVTYDHNGSETSSDAFSFSVDDGLGTASTGTFNFAITPVNDQVPIITSNGGGATANISIAENSTVITSVTALDGDLPSQTITFTIFGGADSALFSINSSTGALTFVSGRNRESHTDADSNGIYEVIVQASDGSLTDTQAISVTITDVDEFDVTTPTDNNATSNQVNENVAIGTTVGITANAFDLDATINTITYTLTSNPDGLFQIDASTGVVTTAAAINREVVGATRTITVRATSADGSFAEQVFSIDINDLDESDVTTPIDNDATTNSVHENVAIGTTVGITANAFDLDATTNTITYSLTSNPDGLFQIDASTGVVTTAAAINREVHGLTRSITVQATSSDGSTATQAFNIAINDLDEFDVSTPTDNDATANSVDENVAIGTTVGITANAFDLDATTNTITYSLTSNPDGLFQIDTSTGVVTTAAAINREVVGARRTITVRATSADGSFAEQVFSIDINDLDESDVTTPIDNDATANNVNENVAIGTTVGITANAFDLDATTNTITYSLTSNPDGLFQIDANTGVVSTAAAINREVHGNIRSITVRAQSSDGSSAEQIFTIAINDLDEFNTTAITDTNATANQVAENASNGTVVGITTFASDADATSNVITYTLDDSAGGRFIIDSTTGVVTVADGSLLDYETVPQHNIIVRATSQDGSFTTANYTINLIDANEGSVSAVIDSNIAANYVLENSSTGTVVGVTGFATDPDGTDTVTYSLDNNAGGRFSIDATTGVVTVNGAIDREASDQYTIIVRATSSDTSFSTHNFIIYIGDVDEFNVGSVIDNNAAVNAVNENAAIGTTVGISAFASDADATTNTITYSLLDNDGGNFQIDSGNGTVTTAKVLDREALGASRNIIVRATSADGSFTDQGFTISINDVDEFDVTIPIDTDATTNVVNENAAIGTVVGITASSIDTDATTNSVTYSLFNDDGGNFQINSSSGVVTTARVLDREAIGASRNITVRATSADGSFADTVFSIGINDVNEHAATTPIDTNAASNSVDENVAIGTTVGITANAFDLDATTNTITYSLTSNPDGLFQIDASTGVVTTAAAINREVVGATRTITVRATSADGSFAEQVFSIDINDLDESDVTTPTDNDATANSVNENVAIGTTVGITANAFDLDATTNTITYSLTSNPDGLFQIDTNTGVVSTAAAINREVHGLTRSITVQATSSDGSTATQAFNIAINDLDEFDVSTPTDNDATVNNVNENVAIGTTVGITANAFDLDATTNTITYSLTSNPDGLFQIDASTGVVTTAAAINREVVGATRTITVRATSADGSFAEQVFSIDINDLDESDVTTPIDNDATANSVDENVAIGTTVGITANAFDLDATTNTITYSLTSNPDGLFQIDANTGVVTTAATINREIHGNIRSITVRAQSSDGSSAEQIFTIAINDLDEFNTTAITDTNATANQVAENASNGTVVGITAFASDADATTNVITYTLDDSAGGQFTIDSTTGVVTVADGSLLDYETVPQHNIIVRATSQDGSFTTANYTINLIDVNEGSVSAISDTNVSADFVLENASIGTVVGTTAFATDPDGTDTVTYSLDDNDGGRFTINSSTGVVTVAGAIDREADGFNRDITVRATSTDGSFTTRTFTITIGDLDEFNVTTPTDNDATANEVDENVAIGTTVGITANAFDLDATTNTITYSLTSNPDGLFQIDTNSGLITTAAAINREVHGLTRAITVQATSSDGSTSSQVFTITINDLDEFNVSTPTETNPVSNSIDENVAIGTTVGITANAFDLDATTNTITYSLTSNPDGLFQIDASTGVVTTAAAINREVVGATRTITVRATSADGSFAEQAFSIDINDVDEFDVIAPTDNDTTANNVDENVAIGTTVGIAANAFDLDATTHTITYNLTNNPDGLFQIDANTGVVTAAAMINREVHGPIRSITVQATSSDGSTATQTFNIAINDLDEFDVTTPSDNDAIANNIDENIAIGTSVGITANAFDLDATSNTITYSLTSNPDGLFQIDANTGVVTTAAAINREVHSLTRSITVQAISSDGSTATQIFNITINDLDEFDVTTPTDSDATANNIDENAAIGTAVGITANAFDLDATTNTITYSLTSNPDGLFQIDANTGVVTTAASINREFHGSVRSITVQAMSSDGSVALQAFTIAINDIDEFDVTTPIDTNPASNNVDENVAVGTTVGITTNAFDLDSSNSTVTYSLTSNPDGLFQIDAITGVVTTAAAINREVHGASRTITVQAASSDGSTSTQTFTIAINDLDEFDVSTPNDTNSAPNNVDENVAIGTAVGITANAFDLDATTNVITYSLTSNPGGLFQIDANTGVVTTAAAINREVHGASRSITVQATSSDGSTSTQTFTIAINDLDEFDVSTPTDSNASNNVVNENAAVGTVVGIQASTFDLDATNNTVSFSLANSSSGRFSVNSITGIVTTARSLNYETDGENHLIKVIATSLDGSTSSADFNIRLVDVNEAPLAVAESFTTQGITSVNLTNRGILSNDSDPDGNTLSLVIISAPNSGTLTKEADGSWVYTPAATTSGRVYFEYYVTDGQLYSTVVKSWIDVQGVAPTATSTTSSNANSPNSTLKPSTQESNVTSRQDASTTNESSNVLGDASSVEQRKTTEQQTNTASNQSANAAAGEGDGQDQVAAAPSASSTEAQLRLNFNSSRELDRLNLTGQSWDSMRSFQDLATGPSTQLVRNFDSSDFEQSFEEDMKKSSEDDTTFELDNAVLTTMLSTGVVIWVLNGAHFLATIVSATPVWMQLDPLIVMSQAKMGVGKDDQEDKSLSIFDVDRKSRTKS